MDLKETLLEIYQSRGRLLTPAIVVEEASPEDSPLHSHFNWDDESAAHSHRIAQARKLMSSVQVVYREGTETDPPQMIRYFHPVMEGDSPSPVWRPIDEIVEDPIAIEVLLREAMRQWQALRRRYAHLNDFWQMIQEDIPEAEAG